jgi:hypothetical protein
MSERQVCAVCGQDGYWVGYSYEHGEVRCANHANAPTPLESKPEAFKQTAEDLNAPEPCEHEWQNRLRGSLCIKCRKWQYERVQGDTKLLQNSEPSDTDEREALYDGAWRAISGRDEPWGGCAAREKVERVAEFAAGFHRQGQITDERDWEYGWNTGSTTLPLGARADAEYFLSQHFDGPQQIGSGDWGSRIQRRREAGPWEVCNAEDNTEREWDDARIREAFIYDGGESAYHDPINGEKEQRRIGGDIFDRWLAARDRRVAAEAWDEGHTAGMRNSAEKIASEMWGDEPEGLVTNPYRADEIEKGGQIEPATDPL